VAVFRVGTVKNRCVLVSDVSSQKNVMNSCSNEHNCFKAVCSLISFS